MDDPLFPLKCFQFGLYVGLLGASPFVVERGYRRAIYSTLLLIMTLILLWLVFFPPA